MNLTILVVLLTALMGIILAQQPVLPICLKIDFNRERTDEFIECYAQFLATLEVKKYDNHPEIEAYRPSSQFFYSPTAEGTACVESKANFQLDENSIIQAAVYVDFKDAGAYVSIIVVDLVKNKEAYIWTFSQPAKWLLVEKKITEKVSKAMIEIRTNLNKNSTVALEYLNVVNSNMSQSECIKDLPPLVTTTTVETTTSTTTMTTAPIDETPTETPNPPGHDEPFNNDHSEDRQTDNVVWIVLGIILAVIFLIVVIVVIYGFLIRPRLATKVLHVTNTVDEDNNSGRMPYVQTIPRLHVMHDPITGPYISGVNYAKRLEEDDMGWNNSNRNQ